jgi:hypothetical protein
MTMQRRKGKVLRILLISTLTATALFFAGRYFVYYQIKRTVESELASLSKQGIFVQYDNLEVDPWIGALEVYNLSVKVRKDSATNHGEHGLEAFLPFIQVQGVQLIPFIRNKTLVVRDIYSHKTSVTYTLQATLFETAKPGKRKVQLENIEIDRVDLPDIDIYLNDRSTGDTVAHILTDVTMQSLLLAKQVDSLTWRKGNVEISNLAMNYNRGNYGMSVKNIQIDITQRAIRLDSLFIKPTLERQAFMREKGKQTNFMETRIPRLEIRGIDWYTFPTPTLQMDRIDLSLLTSMYRDKRLPFMQRDDRPLPSHFLQRLPVRLKVDTVYLRDSFVAYEEMPEAGDSTGVVFFENLNATIMNLHNDRKLKVDGRMHASANFMGVGRLEANFTFPYDTMKQYRVAGTLRDMPLTRINRMLGAAAQAKVESGTMRDLKFNFRYNHLMSTGEVEMNYENLRVLTLRENKKNEQSVSVVKTILLNAFIIRKDMDEDVKDAKRKGEISFYRDTKKSVFNFWWKSILDGIKSAYKLDKLPLKANMEERKRKPKNRKLKETWSKIFDKDKDD